MEEERIKSGHWLGSVLSSLQFLDIVGWMTKRDTFPTIKNLCHLSTKVLSRKKWNKKTEGVQANPGLPRKGSLKCRLERSKSTCISQVQVTKIITANVEYTSDIRYSTNSDIRSFKTSYQRITVNDYF